MTVVGQGLVTMLPVPASSPEGDVPALSREHRRRTILLASEPEAKRPRRIDDRLQRREAE